MENSLDMFINEHVQTIFVNIREWKNYLSEHKVKMTNLLKHMHKTLIGTDTQLHNARKMGWWQILSVCSLL